jgi:hypothetical protein
MLFPEKFIQLKGAVWVFRFIFLLHCVKAYSRNCILMHRLHSSVDPDRHYFVHQGIKLEDLKVLRVLFGCFPTYRSRSGFALSGC